MVGSSPGHSTFETMHVLYLDLPLTAWLVQEEFQEVLSIPLPQMAFNAEGQTYVVLARPQGVLASGKLLNTLKFTVKEIDPATGLALQGDPWTPAPASLCTWVE